MATIEEIKKLRDQTGAGINAVREALAAGGDDFEAALKYLRQKGMAKAEKRKGNATSNGIVGFYMHTNNKFAVLVEVNLETDFAANSADVKEFANKIALQVAAANPEVVNPEDIDPKRTEEVKDEVLKELEGKPENVKENILKGKLDKFYQTATLMKQELFGGDGKTVEDYLNELIAKVGEKIIIKSFVRMEVGKDLIQAKTSN
jgi:elongation factor Ts